MTWGQIGCLVLLMFASFGTNGLRRRSKLGMLRPPIPTGASNPPDEWFTQLLDHFDPTNNQTWLQRYQVVTDYFTEGGPVFIMLGGEGPADSSWLVDSNMVNYAKQYGALMFQIEHRYYGESHPTSDASTDNLVYLSSEQALADIAYFVVGMNVQYNLTSDTKWIAFGGSYSGNLAAWVRLKYPHLIHAAMSASGPVLAKVDFFEYMDVVRNSLGTCGQSCVKAVEMANRRFNQLLKKKSGQKTIDRLFKLCDPIDTTNQNDVWNLLESLADNFAVIVQYNNEGLPYSINTLCDIMTNKTMGSPLMRYAFVNKILLNLFGETCVDYKYNKMIEQLKETNWTSESVSSGDRTWVYQTCTEFGYYQTSESKKEFFSNDFPIQFFLQQCSEIFGEKFTDKEIYDGAYRTNAIYGGLDLQATRVVYVHGTIDPWHALGITSTAVSGATAILINGTAHCANMNPPLPTDPPALKAARKKVGKLIGHWLHES
uniref:Serine protease K12H4.7 n=1 Tax=Homalodisca liturata TaxID=320908 RepID=A0A1B6IAX2_9HEMI